MRYITIPQDITVTLVGAESARVKFVENLMLSTWTLDKKFGVTLAKAIESSDLRALFAGKNPGDTVAVPDALFATLDDVVRNPSEGYLTAVIVQVVSMARAVTDAPTTVPLTLCLPSPGTETSVESRAP